MRLMSIDAVGPKPWLSHAHAEHPVYPYLLRDIAIERVGEVWIVTSTYIRLWAVFVYLTASWTRSAATS